MNIVTVSNPIQLEDAFSIRKKVFVEEQHVPVELEMDHHDKQAVHFVAYDKGHPVGTGRCRNSEGAWKAERVCILPDCRGAGIGKLLMQSIEKYAADQGISTIKLNAQAHAIPFYEKIGYKVVSDEFTEAGIPHKAMEKQLSQL